MLISTCARKTSSYYCLYGKIFLQICQYQRSATTPVCESAPCPCCKCWPLFSLLLFALLHTGCSETAPPRVPCVCLSFRRSLLSPAPRLSLSSSFLFLRWFTPNMRNLIMFASRIDSRYDQCGGGCGAESWMLPKHAAGRLSCFWGRVHGMEWVGIQEEGMELCGEPSRCLLPFFKAII